MRKPEEFYIRLGAGIRKRRKEVGLTQFELSQIIGISRSSLINIEQGKQRIYVDRFFEISDTIGKVYF